VAVTALCAAPVFPRRREIAFVLKLESVRRRLPSMTAKHSARSDCVLIKRYAGRRLYHTVNATYVTRDDLANMILAGDRFTVREAETGTDITRTILDRLH
jgi:hypothetical protein